MSKDRFIDLDRGTVRRGPAEPKISVVVPTFNEAANLPHVFGRLPEGLHEVILVDGRSTDDTIDVARRLPAGAAAPVSFRILGPDGRPVSAYDTAHDEDMHLMGRIAAGLFRNEMPTSCCA